MSSSDSDSDSDYYVEEHLTATTIVAPIKNSEDGDLLGNFDDEKLKERDKGSEDEDDNDSETDNIVYDKIRIKYSEDVQDIVDDIKEPESNTNSTATGKGITEEQLQKLLLGSSKTSRFVLYVTNLTPETSKQDLQDFFAEVGTVKSIRIPKIRSSNFAFVEMQDHASFQAAFTLHNRMLHGRQVKIQISEAGKKKSANKKNIIKQKNRVLAEMRNETKSFLKSGKSFGKTKTGQKRAWARSKDKTKK